METDKLFEEAWSIYPRKKGKKLAGRKYANLLTKHKHEDIIQSVKNFSDEVKGRDLQYVPYGDKFFSVHYLDYLPDTFKREEKSDGPIISKYEIKGYKDYLKLMKYMPYEDYTRTEHWLHFKNEALLFFGHKCQLCDSKNDEIHVHHKTYENRGRETFNDVIPLCSKCHRLVHEL